MSLWQLAHVWLVMKKFDGIVWPTFVFDDEGKNGLFGPAPSPSMLSGGVSGLTILGTVRSAIACRPRTTADEPATTTTASAAMGSASRMGVHRRRAIACPATIAIVSSAPA